MCRSSLRNEMVPNVFFKLKSVAAVVKDLKVSTVKVIINTISIQNIY